MKENIGVILGFIWLISAMYGIYNVWNYDWGPAIACASLCYVIDVFSVNILK